MSPGRYIARAKDGCYWERLSGLGGTLDETITNDFQPFDGSTIVDVLPTDLAFKFNAACGVFHGYEQFGGPIGYILPGAHVVGGDIISGTTGAAGRPAAIGRVSRRSMAHWIRSSPTTT